MVLTAEEQENIRKAIEEQTPEDFGITGRLWTLCDYMKRWGMSCQRPVKHARKQNAKGV